MIQETLAPAIRVRDVVVGFGQRVVLAGVSLDVARGEILGFVGGSGSGKSVLLRTIIGLLPKQSGTIEIAGVDLEQATAEQRLALERRTGVLFQHGALFSSLTARENIGFAIREHLQLSEQMIDDIAIMKLAMVGIKRKDVDKYPAELSGGMTKRVALARALALDPEILFLDEPTSGLDPISAGEFDVLLRTLQQTLGLTVFMVTHDLETLNAVCDRVAVLADGRIAALGSVVEVKNSNHPWARAYFAGRRAQSLAARLATSTA